MSSGIKKEKVKSVSSDVKETDNNQSVENVVSKKKNKPGHEYKLLMLTTLIISGCSMVYELIISAVSSYLAGDSTLQYSITIGLYMFALGLGSFLSKFIKRNLWGWFAKVEIGIGIIGGTCSLILFLSHIYLISYQIVMYLEILAIGTLAGLEIPLLTRIIEEDRKELRLTLSSIFSFDYIGGLIGSVAFPMVLLPSLGYFATCFMAGAMNLTAAALIIFKYRKRLKNSHLYKATVIVLLAGMVTGMVFSENIGNLIEDGLYRDRVILSEQTQYQKIVVTKHRDDLRLYIDGNCQFSTMDEYRYHEALVHIPLAYAQRRDKVLVLGGGDGMAARELLKYPETHVTLIDLDKGMTDLCSTDPQITEVNKNSLTDKRVRIINNDAYKYLEESNERYDVIIVDLPDPNNVTLNKLYTNVFYRLCAGHLNEGGIINVQSTSPYYAKKAYWCINKTIASEGMDVKSFHLQVPAFGDWGFNMASMKKLEKRYHLPEDTRFLTEKNLSSLFVFGKDETADDVEINSLTNPVLIQYYNDAVREWE